MSSNSSHKQSLVGLLVGLAIAASAGCAGNLDQLRPGRAAGEWQVRLPESRSAVGDLAMGRGGRSEPAASWFDGSPGDMANSQPRVAVGAKKASRGIERRKIATPVRHVELAALPEQPHQAEQPKAAVPSSVASLAYPLADASPHDRYAQREQRSQQQQSFKGGDRVLVIGVSTLVVVLIVVLLLVLLL